MIDILIAKNIKINTSRPLTRKRRPSQIFDPDMVFKMLLTVIVVRYCDADLILGQSSGLTKE